MQHRFAVSQLIPCLLPYQFKQVPDFFTFAGIEDYY